MRKVAIVFGQRICDDNIDEFVAQHITDWAEVSDSDYQLLKSYVKRIYPEGVLLEAPSSQEACIPKTIEKCLALCNKDRETAAKRKQAEDYRKLKTSELKKERELKKLKELQEKYGAQ